MNTIDRIELARIRADAAAKHRKSGIAEQAARLDTDDDDYTDVRNFAIIVAGMCLLVALGYAGIGYVKEQAAKARDAQYEREVIAECKAEGNEPKVERGADGRTLAVRCEREVRP